MENYSFIIRKAQESDIPVIREITLEAFKKYIQDTGLSATALKDTLPAINETFDDIKKDIAEKEVLVAFIDNIPVGSVRLEILPDKTAYISRFGVRLDYHNIGIGKALMNVVDKIAKNLHLTSVSLHTASKYSALVRFYYGRGFYVDSTTHDRGYVRALLIKDYTS